MTDKEKKLVEQEKRLQAQIDSNPELLRLGKIIAERGKEIWQEYENEYLEILNSYKDYCRSNGLVMPKDKNEFFHWVAIAYPDENLPYIIEVAKRPHNYKRFHEYKERLFNNPEWSEEKEFEYLQKEIAEPQQVNKKPQTLKDLICHEKSEEIVKEIKEKYKNIKGKRLKLLLMAFQELDLIPKERESSNFHRLCKSEFNWDIASYQAMNDYPYNSIIDEVEFREMKLFLENLKK